MLRASSIAWIVLSVSGLLAGCNPDPVGDEIGTYQVTMSLKENTCGPSALHEQDGHRYRVQLRANETRGYWRLPGQPALEGRFDAGEFVFGFGSVADQSPEDAETFCQILQEEALTGSVATLTADGGSESPASDQDAGAEQVVSAEGLVGEHVFTLRAADGTDCTAALVAAGGGFEMLPCKVRYSLTGTPTESF